VCLAAVLYRVVDGFSAVVVANREEFYARPASRPQIRQASTPVLCGTDLRAGGTWLGVNGRGVIVGVTNRDDKAGDGKIPAVRSRGLLCADLLACPNAESVVADSCRELRTGRYADCNLFCVDAGAAYVVHGGSDVRVAVLSPGIHVLTSGDVDDSRDLRVRRASEFLAAKSGAEMANWEDHCKELCRLHGDDGPPICLHGIDRGTVSSTIIALHRRIDEARYLHSSGPPCMTEYEDFSDPLQAQVLGV